MYKEILAIIHNDDVDIFQCYEALPQRLRDHCTATANLTASILSWAREERLYPADAAQIETVRRAAIYHDIGFTLIPEQILHKKEDLTGAEARVLQQHTIYGGSLLDKYRKAHASGAEQNDFWSLAAEIALNHHEQWNGKGYPYEQMTTAIPFEARAAAIANAYDSIVRGSPNRMPLPPEYALLEVLQNSGKQFDPELVELIRQHFDSIDDALLTR